METLAVHLARRARAASRRIALASTAQKDALLRHLAEALVSPAALSTILEANRLDLASAIVSGLPEAMVDRLRLDRPRLQSLQQAVLGLVSLADPVGRIDELISRPSGIVVGRMRVPLGVVLMIYESRPNVTVDAAALALKAGNAVILRGGKEAMHTNKALAGLVHAALEAEGLPRDAVVFVDDPDRELLYSLLQCSAEIDLAIPRGGTALIDAVSAHARMPVIQHYQGICHVYVHRDADVDMALAIIENGKTSRPGVCNATECALIDAAVAPVVVPRVVTMLRAHGVEIVGCERTRAIAPDVQAAVEDDWHTEFLRKKIALKVVDDDADALAFIAAHGTRHTESIVTNNHAVAMNFLRAVDASCVLVNASTRFNDGGELGLGAELGISTTKMHAYGPMGLEELCTRKFVVLGHGEVRR
jgi:glutamate-5-semialdehyde dehydrogenase